MSKRADAAIAQVPKRNDCHWNKIRSFSICPSKTGGIMWSPVAGGRATFSSLSGAYLQNYTSYGYEILFMDRSHQERVHCTWTVTGACFIFELLPFVYFHTWIWLQLGVRQFKVFLIRVDCLLLYLLKELVVEYKRSLLLSLCWDLEEHEDY